MVSEAETDSVLSSSTSAAQDISSRSTNKRVRLQASNQSRLSEETTVHNKVLNLAVEEHNLKLKYLDEEHRLKMNVYKLKEQIALEKLARLRGKSNTSSFSEESIEYRGRPASSDQQSSSTNSTFGNILYRSIRTADDDSYAFPTYDQI